LQDVFIPLELYSTPYEQSFSKTHDRGSLRNYFEYIVNIKNIMMYKVTAAIINEVNLTQKLGSILIQ